MFVSGLRSISKIMPTVSRGLFNRIFQSPAVLEDFGDRINHVWTFSILLLLAVIISWNQGYNDPISCWTPDNFTAFQSSYARDVCWNSHIIQYPFSFSHDFFYDVYEMSAPVDHPIVIEKRASMNKDFPYKTSATRTVYQWLPIVLCLQAILFKLPYIFMSVLHGISGITFDRIYSFTRGFENLHLQDRCKLCKRAGQFVYDWCVSRYCPLPWRSLTVVWFLTKILYCVNVVLQLVFVDSFLRTTYMYNVNSLAYTDIITSNIFSNNATEWKESSAFPRIIHCLFEINQVRDLDRYHIQCHLPANAFNEQICVFVWVWFHFVAVTTILSVLSWSLRVLWPSFRKRYISGALEKAEVIKESDLRADELQPFCNVIGEDGVMVLKLIGVNSSESLIGDIVGSMWKLRQDRYEKNFQKGAEKLSKKFHVKQMVARASHNQEPEPEPEPETDI